MFVSPLQAHLLSSQTGLPLSALDGGWWCSGRVTTANPFLQISRHQRTICSDKFLGIAWPAIHVRAPNFSPVLRIMPPRAQHTKYQRKSLVQTDVRSSGKPQRFRPFCGPCCECEKACNLKSIWVGKAGKPCTAEKLWTRGNPQCPECPTLVLPIDWLPTYAVQLDQIACQRNEFQHDDPPRPTFTYGMVVDPPAHARSKVHQGIV